jgi:hypothetical protein
MCKRLISPGIDSKESIPRNRFRQATYAELLSSLKCLQIRALVSGSAYRKYTSSRIVLGAVQQMSEGNHLAKQPKISVFLCNQLTEGVGGGRRFMG